MSKFKELASCNLPAGVTSSELLWAIRTTALASWSIIINKQQFRDQKRKVRGARSQVKSRVLEENSVRCRVFKGRRSDAQEAHSTTRHAPHGQQAGAVLPDLADFGGGGHSST